MALYRRNMSRKDESGDVGLEAGVRFSMGFLRPRPHHHDITSVKQLLLGAAVLMLVSAPFYGESLRVELPFELIGALVIVSLVAITRTMERVILTADAIAAGVGLSIYQTWALFGYIGAGHALSIAFVLRETLAVLFMFAFYFSVMASRSMIIREAGETDSSDEVGGDLEDVLPIYHPDDEEQYRTSALAEDEREVKRARAREMKDDSERN